MLPVCHSLSSSRARPRCRRLTKTRRLQRRTRLRHMRSGFPNNCGDSVAPIALYPNSLVAQVLAASTFPESVVEAEKWTQAHSGLKGEAFGKGVDQHSWDPSIDALPVFPSVRANMDKNLSWTSSLGDYDQSVFILRAGERRSGRGKGVGPDHTRQTERRNGRRTRTAEH